MSFIRILLTLLSVAFFPHFALSQVETGLFFGLSGDVIATAASFNAQLDYIYTGPLISSPDVIKPVGLNFAYVTDSGQAAAASLGYNVTDNIAVELEYRYLGMEYNDTYLDTIFDVNTGKDTNLIQLGTTISGFLANVYFIYDTGVSMLWYGGLGVGFASVTDSITYGPVERLFSTTSSQTVMQVLLGAAIIIDDHLSLIMRITFVDIPNYGVLKIEPIDSATAFVPDSVKAYNIRGIRDEFFTFGLGIRINI